MRLPKLLLTAALSLVFCSCQMSEDNAAKVGTPVGAILGAGAAYGISKATGTSDRNTVFNSIGGAVAGGALGNKVGRNSSDLKGLKSTTVPN